MKLTMQAVHVLEFMCGGGGAAAGMIQAGAEVVGVDIDPLCAKWYPGRFILHDVFTIESILDWERLLAWSDLNWGSPVCRRYSVMTAIRGDQSAHPDQVPRLRAMFQRLGKPYIIENVPGAPLRKDVELCGLMFKLRSYRHRIFETSFPVEQPFHPKHEGQQKYSIVGRLVSTTRRGGNKAYQEMKAEWPEAMGITHINVNASTTDGHNMFSQAIPPAFSKYLIEQFVKWRDR